MGANIASTDDDIVISPRQQILSSPYALQADYATYSPPVGTVITSTLNFEAFKLSAGERSNFDPAKSIWAPADGRSVAGSKYAELAGGNSAPDFRGVFTRGLNTFDTAFGPRTDAYRDEEPNRPQFQIDTIRSHRHYQFVGFNVDGPHQGTSNNTSPVSTFFDRVCFDDANCDPWPSYNMTQYQVPGYEANTLPGSSNIAAGIETRPKNIAVYRYIRIN